MIGCAGGGDGLYGTDATVDDTAEREGGGDGLRDERRDVALADDEMEDILGCKGGGEGLCRPSVAEDETGGWDSEGEGLCLDD